MAHDTTTPVGDTEDGHVLDSDLVRAAQADSAAFAPLYQRYRDRVYRYLRTRTNSDEDAADLTQQVFLQALDALPRYRIEQTPFAAWLTRIAHNLAANDRRRKTTVPWDYVPEAHQPLVEGDLDDHVLRDEALAQLREAIQAFNASAREVLALHFAAGLTIAETAVVVGRSEAAVKKQLTRTLHVLKERYHERAQ
jgi:RNA polymerase sigma-70 factor (ECF subfamily)